MGGGKSELNRAAQDKICVNPACRRSLPTGARFCDFCGEEQGMAARSTQVMTTVKCYKCGFEVSRPFMQDDMVLKRVGKCQQCGGAVSVVKIFQE